MADLRVVVEDAGHRLLGDAGRHFAQRSAADPAMPGHGAAFPRQQVVEHQPGPDHRAGSPLLFGLRAEKRGDRRQRALEPGRHRNQRRQRRYAMRRVLQEKVAFPERLPHQVEFAVLQIAQPAMHHARQRRTRARAEIVALQKHHIDALQRQLAKRADAVDAAADDDDIGLFRNLPGYWGCLLHVIRLRLPPARDGLRSRRRLPRAQPPTGSVPRPGHSPPPALRCARRTARR